MQELGWETEITDRQLPAGGSPSPIQSIACIAAPRHTAAIT
jgi:hypothetical protein